MNAKNLIIVGIMITIIFIIFFVYQLLQMPSKPEIIDIALNYDPGGQRITEEFAIFNMWSYEEFWNSKTGEFALGWIERKNDYDYSNIEAGNQNTIFIIPIFTHSAYWQGGFYNYYNDKCDKTCLTTKLAQKNPFTYESSRHAILTLSLLGYDYITDVEVTNTPDILNKYDKIIVLHNEYVTSEEFEAITNHPKVMYLYPNSLYAEVEYNQENNTITLLRGHGYPEKSIANGFDWEFDNTHPYEFDTKCDNWEFYEIANGHMLNCYPEYLIFNDESLLKAIRDY